MALKPNSQTIVSRLIIIWRVTVDDEGNDDDQHNQIITMIFNLTDPILFLSQRMLVEWSMPVFNIGWEMSRASSLYRSRVMSTTSASLPAEGE